MSRNSRKDNEIFRNLSFIYVFICAAQVRIVSSAVSTCGGTLEGTTGTFTSPNYPFPPNNEPNAQTVRTSSEDGDDMVTCEWKILVPAGRGIQFTFGEFNMAAGLDQCNKGELEVFSGVGREKKSLDKYCGNDELKTVLVKTNSSTVIFRRPHQFLGKGFLVSYVATEPGDKLGDFVTCNDLATDHVGVNSFSVHCPGGCANISEHIVFGIQEYKDNSHLCKAAVHAGAITDRFGGRIAVRKLPGLTYYDASEANGIQSSVGPMSDFRVEIKSPDANCDDELVIKPSQLTASTYWTTDVNDPEKTKWRPDKGILDKQIEVWSPSDPTTEQWLQVDLRGVKIITEITTRPSTSNYYTCKSYRIAFRNDTSTPWVFYREEGTKEDKVFSGNNKIFKFSKNNFIRPRIVARFLRVYPTPVKREDERYALQIQLNGCPAAKPNIVMEPTESPEVIETLATTTKRTTPREVVETTGPIVEPEVKPVPEMRDSSVNTTSTESITRNVTPLVVVIPDEVPVTRTPVEDPPGDLSENSIIVIAIVAALAVTSILLATLVLVLVRKRKKDPKTDIASTPLPNPHITNNNTQFHYKSKKSKKRRKNGEGDSFRDPGLLSATLQPQNSINGMIIPQSATLPAEQVGFLTNGRNGSAFVRDGMFASSVRDVETDSFDDDDDDHEYQDISDEVVQRRTPVHSIHASSSKASTGSSLGNHSRKSDTMQRTWGTAGDGWNKAPFSPNSPMFPVSAHQRSIHSPNSQFSSFSSVNHPNSAFQYPNNTTNGPQPTRTFPHEVHYSVSNGQISDGAHLPPNHPNLRRGSSQSPSRFQRHSSSSNNSAHSHPSVGMTPYPNDQSNPYYSSVPNGESNTVTALNHHSYLLYGDSTIPEHKEAGVNESRRKPSYKVPRQQSGLNEPPALPEKKLMVHGLSQTESEPSITHEYNGGQDHFQPHSQSMRSDYDRLYRDNSVSGPSDGYNKNIFSLLNGSQSQYNQLNLNAAPV